jgi:hypothetical protein
MKSTLMITLLIIGLILGYSIESNITVESVNSFELIVKEWYYGIKYNDL